MFDTTALTREIQKAVEFKNVYPFGHQPPPGTPPGLWNPWVIHMDTLFWSWVAMALLILLAVYLRPRLKLVPDTLGVQNVMEWMWDFFNQIARDLVAEESPRYMPVVMTIFFFVLLGNMFGLIPTLIPFTRDANTTVGLAIYSFLAFTYYGIAKKGFFRWVIHFAEPVPGLRRTLEGPLKYIMIPPLFFLFVILNFIEETARIISLSMRLFGNIMGKHIVMAVLLGLAVYLTKFFDALPLFVWLIGLIASIVQAMIFALLTLAYIAGAVGEHH